MHTPREHRLRIEHEVVLDHGEEAGEQRVGIEKEDTIDAQARSLRQWVHESLKREDNTAAHRLLAILSSVVWWQGYEIGWEEAGRLQEWTIRDHTEPTFKDGYEAGWQDRKSETET